MERAIDLYNVYLFIIATKSQPSSYRTSKTFSLLLHIYCLHNYGLVLMTRYLYFVYMYVWRYPNNPNIDRRLFTFVCTNIIIRLLSLQLVSTRFALQSWELAKKLLWLDKKLSKQAMRRSKKPQYLPW